MRSRAGKKDKQQSANKKTEKSKPKQICKLFVKYGSCKKGMKCEFSHDTQVKKAPTTVPEKKEVSATTSEKKDVGNSSDDSSSNEGNESGKDHVLKGKEIKDSSSDDSSDSSDNSSSTDVESD